VDSPVVGVSIVACTIMAHWAPSTFSISPSSRSLLTSNITDSSKFFEQDAPASILHMGSAIDIQDTWVPFLNPQLDTSSANTAFDSSVLLALSLAVVASNATTDMVVNTGAYFGLELNAYLYDWSNGTVVIRDLDEKEVGTWNGTAQELKEYFRPGVTSFEFSVEKYGFGSGKPGPTMDFAIAVVCVYFDMIAGYFFYVAALSYYRWPEAIPTIVGWGDIQNMLFLAWNSKPSEKLAGVSVEAKGIKIFRYEVMIRAEGGRVQLCVVAKGGEGGERGEDEMLTKLVRDKEYL